MQEAKPNVAVSHQNTLEWPGYNFFLLRRPTTPGRVEIQSHTRGKTQNPNMSVSHPKTHLNGQGITFASYTVQQHQVVLKLMEHRQAQQGCCKWGVNLWMRLFLLCF
jgi:hypothetical protein